MQLGIVKDRAVYSSAQAGAVLGAFQAIFDHLRARMNGATFPGAVRSREEHEEHPKASRSQGGQGFGAGILDTAAEVAQRTVTDATKPLTPPANSAQIDAACSSRWPNSEAERYGCIVAGYGWPTARACSEWAATNDPLNIPAGIVGCMRGASGGDPHPRYWLPDANGRCQSGTSKIAGKCWPYHEQGELDAGCPSSSAVQDLLKRPYTDDSPDKIAECDNLPFNPDLCLSHPYNAAWVECRWNTPWTRSVTDAFKSVFNTISNVLKCFDITSEYGLNCFGKVLAGSVAGIPFVIMGQMIRCLKRPENSFTSPGDLVRCLWFGVKETFNTIWDMMGPIILIAFNVLIGNIPGAVVVALKTVVKPLVVQAFSQDVEIETMRAIIDSIFDSVDLFQALAQGGAAVVAAESFWGLFGGIFARFPGHTVVGKFGRVLVNHSSIIAAALDQGPPFTKAEALLREKYLAVPAAKAQVFIDNAKNDIGIVVKLLRKFGGFLDKQVGALKQSVATLIGKLDGAGPGIVDRIFGGLLSLGGRLKQAADWLVKTTGGTLDDAKADIDGAAQRMKDMAAEIERLRAASHAPKVTQAEAADSSSSYIAPKTETWPPPKKRSPSLLPPSGGGGLGWLVVAGVVLVVAAK